MTWEETNQRYSMAALGEVRAAIERLLATDGPQVDPPEAPPLMADSALETVCRGFGLSAFERRILLLCAGVEWDSRFAALCASAQGEARRVRPTFSLALAAFDEAHWSALSPTRPLRYWRLIQVSDSDALTTATLRIDERILHYLAGVPGMDEWLRPLLRHIAPPLWLAPSHEAVAERIAAVWGDRGGRPLPIIQLAGEDADKRTIAAAGCARLGLTLYSVGARQLPQSAAEMDTFRRLWEREAILTGGALLVEGDEADANDAVSEAALLALMETLHTPLAIAGRNLRRASSRTALIYHVHRPTTTEQDALWRNELQSDFPVLNGEVTALVSQFSLGAPTIRAAAEEARRGSGSPGGLEAQLWEACRVQARPRMEGLAQRIEAAARWDDLVLPEKQRETLRQLSIHVRRRSEVYESWGFASKGARGLGISALFAGPSGTGKTMAAEVLANELRLDLFRIDLSQVVSKYIGETEKNLSRVFNAADEGAAILLFDEADALFGKRSEVKDSHDRYANIEVSYLLQRMEAYRGLAILTTNRKFALDQAFLRRIRFVVEFPFPDAAQRAEIWSRVFPRETPIDGLRIDRLARLHASGAHIRNIAMSAAFLAADAGEPVRMAHLLTAARSEFDKLEKSLTDGEVAGWI